ncbi:MAG TPA: type VI secretion system baseplate subunit TssG [Gemmataceae bacterium]|nr:type VI secretion system baseplate subunit TssG [Gemmataceae bacterium]
MPSVKDRLFAEFYEFDFFQAVRLLERALPGRKPIGLDFVPADEVARFRPNLSLAFPPSQIIALDPPSEDRPNHLATVTFFGLYGVNGALPTHYTQMMMDLVRDMPRSSPERRSLRDWLDLFNHRLISLFYRAWEKYRFHIAYERGEARRKEPDTFTTAVRSLMGLGSAGHQDRLEVRSAECGARSEDIGWNSALRAPHSALARSDDLGLLYYAGFFAQRPRNAANLRALLADYFDLPVEVQQFRGTWLAIPADRQSRLGELGTLGMDAIAGERVWDVTARFRTRLGPLSYARFEELLPDQSAVRERKMFFLVAQLARLFVGPELDFDIQLVLSAKEVPEAFLGESPGAGPRLGWNVWLISETPANHADDAVFEADWVTELV